MDTYYVDASALVKLVLQERESEALRAFVESADLIASELVLTEVPRAVRRVVQNQPPALADGAVARAGALLESMVLLPIDEIALAAAGAITEPTLRSLDAIHVISAAEAHPVDAFVTYDKRQAAAARMAGLQAVAPGA